MRKLKAALMSLLCCFVLATTAFADIAAEPDELLFGGGSYSIIALVLAIAVLSMAVAGVVLLIVFRKKK